MIEGLGLLGMRKEAAAYNKILRNIFYNGSDAPSVVLWSKRAIKQADQVYNARLLDALKRRYTKHLEHGAKSPIYDLFNTLDATSNPRKLRKVTKQTAGAFDDLNLRLRAIDQASSPSDLTKIRNAVLPRYNPDFYNGSAAKQLKELNMLPHQDGMSEVRSRLKLNW